MNWDQIEARWAEMTLRIRPPLLEGSQNFPRTVLPADRALPVGVPSDTVTNDGRLPPNR